MQVQPLNFQMILMITCLWFKPAGKISGLKNFISQFYAYQCENIAITGRWTFQWQWSEVVGFLEQGKDRRARRIPNGKPCLGMKMPHLLQKNEYLRG